MNKSFEENMGRLTTDEAREIGRKGGLASVESRREQKNLKALVEMLGGMAAPERVRQVMATMGIEQGERTNNMAAVVGLFQKAIKGDVAAFNAIRDIRGEKPADDINVSGALDNRIEIGMVESGITPVSNEDDIAD